MRDKYGHKLVLKVCQSCREEKWMRPNSVSCSLSCNGKKGIQAMHDTGDNWYSDNKYRKKQSISTKKFHEENPSFRSLVSLKGKDNPAYKHGEARGRKRLGFTESLKQLIRNRDNNICQMCGRKRNKKEIEFDVHHIDENKNNPSPDNLVTLCRSCHSSHHRNS